MLLTYLSEAFFLLSAAVLVYAAFILHRRARAIPTLLLLLSLTLLFVHQLVLPGVVGLLSSLLGRAQWVVWLWHAAVPATLQLFVALSFLSVALLVLRPNNSFKPTPLRGAA